MAGAKLLAPGQPARSTLLMRMRSTDSKTRMPPLGTLRVDDAGAALIDAFISSLSGCP